MFRLGSLDILSAWVPSLNSRSVFSSNLEYFGLYFFKILFCPVFFLLGLPITRILDLSSEWMISAVFSSSSLTTWSSVISSAVKPLQ